MFEGGSENPTIYAVTHLGKPTTTLGYLEIVAVDDGSRIEAKLLSGVGWPIGVPHNTGVVFERVTDVPDGNFDEEHSSVIDGPSSAFQAKHQIPDGGYEIGKWQQDGWKQIGLMLNEDAPEQTTQLGKLGDEFPIPMSIGKKIRITRRSDITTTRELLDALNHDLGNQWTGFEYRETYSSDET